LQLQWSLCATCGPWTARYRCVLALARDGVTLLTRTALLKARPARNRAGRVASVTIC
jgi:hypothetical protein